MSQVDRNVFVSYSHADAAWLERLKVHLRPLVRRGTLKLWDDTRISPGQAWQTEVAGALAQARVAVLLVSADFLASDFVADNELPALLHRAASGGVLILPIVIGPCLFSEHEELSRYQCVNSPNKPLSLMTSPDAEAVLVSLARSVDKYFRLIEASPEQSNQAGDPLVVDRPINLGFDGATINGVPIGWFNSFGYVSGVSTEYFIGTSRRSEDRMAGMFAVLSDVDAKPTEFGSLMQRCPGRFLAGKTIRFEGELRSEDVSGWAGLWLRADAEAQPNLFFDNMSRRPVVGTTPWSRYSIDARLPRNTDWLNYGIVLSGSGHLSADNLRMLQWSDGGRWEDI